MKGIELLKQRRTWVYEEFNKFRSSHQAMRKKEISRKYKSLWAEAKRKYK